MRDRRYLIVAIICFALAALVAWCGVANAQSVIGLVGIGTSGNLGEENPGYQAQLLVADRRGPVAWEASGLFDTANKYTGAGYSANATLDVAVLTARDVGALVGVEYGYRSGGAWAKQGVWIRAGVEGRRADQVFRILARATFDGSANDSTWSRILEAEIRQRVGHWWLTGEGGVVWYTQAGERRAGFYSALRIGREFGRLHG